MKRLFCFSFFLCFTLLSVSSQEKETFKDKYQHFLIKVTDVQTQKFADRNNGKEKAEKPSWVPELPPDAVFEREYEIKFLIKPEDYFQHTIRIIDDEESLSRVQLVNVLKVNRESLIGAIFSPFSFSISEKRDFNRHKKDEYQIIEIDKDATKEICEFDCYKVIAKKRSRMVEMYVTESIDLNYNPAFTNPHLLKQFYPLYVKEYLDAYPNDVYKEYVFYKQ